MKLKLLLAPSIIILSVILLIWMVYPAYTNGTDGAREKYQTLEKQKEMTASLLARLDNVKKLGNALDNDASAKNTIFNYIPQNKEDEKVIENLNFLAMKNSLAVLNISLSEPADSLALTPAPVDTVSSQVATPVKKITPKKLMANFSVFGSYENMRVLLDNLSKMKRFNKISILEIKSTRKEDQSLSENLQMNIGLEFDYLLDNYNLTDEDINNDVFVGGVFDKKIVDEIVKSKNVDVNNVLPGEIGTSNPFLLQ
ncbi:MAG: hypothetical protein WA064_03340 [Candidatus Moraniibacteriota bacterium]